LLLDDGIPDSFFEPAFWIPLPSQITPVQGVALMYRVAKENGGQFDWGQRWDKMSTEKMMAMVKEVGERENKAADRRLDGGFPSDAEYDKEIEILYKIYIKLKYELMKRKVSIDAIEEQHGYI
jgi:hypothetical protein